jgi:hypothetical protein
MKTHENIKTRLVKAIEEASWVVEDGDAHDLIDVDDAYITVYARDIINLIESLSAKLEHAGRERDALLMDLRDADQCGCSHCKHYKHCLAEEAEDAYEDYDYVCSACGRDDCPCKTCAANSNWEWRGAE